MTSPKLSGAVRAVALLVISLTLAHGQPAGADRTRSYDVQHYVIRISFDVAKRKVLGDTSVKFTPLTRPLSEAVLDAVGLSFTSVKLEPDGRPLSYRTSGGKVTVALDRTYTPGEAVSIRFAYSTAPKKGVYFIPAETSAAKLKHPAQIWTQNQPEDARYWFPSFDFPSDKATSEALITVQKGETVIGNGELVDTLTNADRTVTFHYRMDVPHSTYLTSFVVGDYVRVADRHRTIPLGFYVYRDRRSLADAAFSRTKEMMAAFESVTGVEYPFKKYDQIMVAGFQQFSGMENITATTLADAELLFAQYSFGKPMVEDLVAHELAHSWFGNNVTCRNWSELWLNEGFATFFEAVSRERLYGRDSYIRKLKSDLDIFLADEAINKNRHALQNRLARADDSLFDATTYQKGGLVIHMLRSEIGDDAFWKGVNLYLSRHRFDSVVSADLRAAMESAAGRDLKWFFDQWVYAAGSPRLEISRTYDASAGVLNISVAQVQKDDGITPSVFRLPLDLEIATPSGPVREKVDITKRQETFAVKVPGAPTGLTVDAAEKIILKTVKIN